MPGNKDPDRWLISEAIRRQGLWHFDAIYRYKIVLVTGYDERLIVEYGRTGRVKGATYTHWDRDTGEVVCREPITIGKRERVLHLINQGRGR